jgi:hypothetical protein
LPAQIGTIEAKRAILAAAVEDGGHPSARRLDRALLEWLDRAANENPATQTGVAINSQVMP